MPVGLVRLLKSLFLLLGKFQKKPLKPIDNEKKDCCRKLEM
jgi:hypothetical protein